MQYQIPLLPFQMEILTNPTKYLWACWGLGTGKSVTLAHYALTRILENPETMGFIGTPEWDHIHATILPKLEEEWAKVGLVRDRDWFFNGGTNMITLPMNGGQIKCFSLKNFETLRGVEIGWFCIDEACKIKEAAFKVVIGRLRCKRSHRLQGRLFSTPNGFDWMYDRFVTKASAKYALTRATTYDNYRQSREYADDLVEGYSPKEARQEVFAEFVTHQEGLVYHAFDRTEHVRPTNQIMGHKVWVGEDFNVNPGTAVLGNLSGGVLRVFDELYVPDSNTFRMAAELKTRQPHASVTITPDASGSAKKTSSTKSDHQIMRDAGFEVLTRRKNPAIVDRFNAVNQALRDGKLYIDPKCEKLIRDLERVTHEDNPKYLTHISDALGYLVWHHFPLRKPVEPFQRIKF